MPNRQPPTETTPPATADPLVPKHHRFGQNAYDRAQARAAGEGRTIVDVLRAFLVKYGNGELPAP